MKKLSLTLITLLLGVCQLFAIDPTMLRFHNEESDTVRINQIMSKVQAQRLRAPGDVMVAIAEEFIGTPYVAATLEGEPELLTVNLDELDCTTLVENVLAMALTLEERRSSWRDYIYNLERIRYRNGQLNGYPSRLHYNADWGVDNTHRGNLVDVTNTFPKFNYMTRSLDFMSENADKYPALADSANLAGIKNIEIGYRSHRFPYIKTIDIANKAVKGDFKNGDIVAFIGNIKNLDALHMGIIKIIDGEPYVIHASSTAGKVVVSDRPLADYLKRNRQFIGVRVYRLPSN